MNLVRNDALLGRIHISPLCWYLIVIFTYHSSLIFLANIMNAKSYSCNKIIVKNKALTCNIRIGLCSLCEQNEDVVIPLMNSNLCIGLNFSPLLPTLVHAVLSHTFAYCLLMLQIEIFAWDTWLWEMAWISLWRVSRTTMRWAQTRLHAFKCSWIMTQPVSTWFLLLHRQLETVSASILIYLCICHT
jgi:hypothetical protein